MAAGIKKDKDLNLSFTALDFMPYEDGYAESQEAASFDEYLKQAIENGDL